MNLNQHNILLAFGKQEPKIVSIFQLVFLMVKFHSKFNFSCTLGLKLSKSNPPHHHHHDHHGGFLEGFFQQYQKHAQTLLLFFCFHFNEFSMKKLFNIQ
jgi:hypothetical protein